MMEDTKGLSVRWYWRLTAVNRRLNLPVIYQVYESSEQTTELDAQTHATSEVADLKLEAYH